VWLTRAAARHLMQDGAAVCPDVACPDISDPDSTVPERWASPSLIERVKMEPAGYALAPRQKGLTNPIELETPCHERCNLHRFSSISRSVRPCIWRPLLITAKSRLRCCQIPDFGHHAASGPRAMCKFEDSLIRVGRLWAWVGAVGWPS